MRRGRARRLECALAPIALALATASSSPGDERDDGAGRADPIPLPPVTAPAWEPVPLPGVEHETTYRPAEGDAALRAVAECSASGRAVRLDGVDLGRTPVLRWRWRVEQGLDVPDERTREGDDFAARVSVLFPFEPERAGWLETLRHRLTGRLAGREVPGSALYLVWTDRVEPGTVWENPYTSAVMMRAVARGPAEGWRTEAVDVARAYRDAFGRPPPEPAAVALMTDSDNTCARAVALYADFRFTAAGEASP